jgi:hypothetical protein
LITTAGVGPLCGLFDEFVFYFPQVGAFNNANINPSKFSFESLKVLILRCGGIILHSLSKAANTKVADKVLVRMKCDPKFNRIEVDCKLAMLESNKKGLDSEEYSEVLVDFHWVTDSVYTN